MVVKCSSCECCLCCDCARNIENGNYQADRAPCTNCMPVDKCGSYIKVYEETQIENDMKENKKIGKE